MLKNPNHTANLRPGMHVWYEQAETENLVEAVVSELTTTTVLDPNSETQITVPAAKLCGVETSDTVILPYEYIFRTKTSIVKALQLDVEAQVRKFAAMMKTPEDIIRFAWEHPVAVCEGTDWIARLAFERQVLEVMDIVLY